MLSNQSLLMLYGTLQKLVPESVQYFPSAKSGEYIHDIHSLKYENTNYKKIVKWDVVKLIITAAVWKLVLQ